MNEIIAKVKFLVGSLVAGYDVFEYTSNGVFTLTEPNATAASIKVYKAGILYGNWTFSATSNKITFTGLTAGNVVEIFYDSSKYSDTQIGNYIRSALVYVSVNNYKEFEVNGSSIFPTPDEKESNVIALIACILIKPNISSYKTSEVSIVFEKAKCKEDKIIDVMRSVKTHNGITEFHAICEPGFYNEDQTLLY